MARNGSKDASSMKSKENAMKKVGPEAIEVDACGRADTPGTEGTRIKMYLRMIYLFWQGKTEGH